MSQVSDYSVSFPYGATSAPYSPSHPHRGDDRPTPVGTELRVAGTLIGYTGQTGVYQGQTYDPHCHYQEWNGDVATTRKPQKTFEGGTVIAVSNDENQEWGRYITIRLSDGWNGTYAHLSKINVKVGDTMATLATETHVDMLAHAFLGDSYKDNPGLAFYVGQPLEDVVSIFNSSKQRDTFLKNQENVLNIADIRGSRLNSIASLVGAKNGDDYDTIVNNIKSGSSAKPTVLSPGVYKVG